MKFFQGLSALLFSGLVATTLAAPAPVADAEVAPVIQLKERAYDTPQAAIEGLLVVVRSHTLEINKTIAAYDGGVSISFVKKIEITTKIKSHCTEIIKEIFETCGTLKLFTKVKLVEIELKAVIDHCVCIFLEICCTLIHCCKVLKTTIISLIGGLAISFLACLIAFVQACVSCFIDFFVNFEACIELYKEIILQVFPGWCICSIV